jgi:hypothetical protein
MHQVLLTIKTSAEIKGILQEIAWKELRTLSGQVEMILLQWLEAKGHIEKEDKNLSSPMELNGR